MLAIILVNYKDEVRTAVYVKEELSKISIPHYIIVVNNSSTPESDNKLTSDLNAVLTTDIQARPVVSECYIISQPENLGFAKGNNLGATFALQHFKINHFLISNNDIRFIDSNVVEKLVERLDSLHNVGLIGPKVVGLDGRKQSPEPYLSIWNRYVWMHWLTPFLSTKKKAEMFKLDYSEIAEEGVHYKIMGSFFIVKAADFQGCGLMDPNTFLYSEELILSERLKSIGKYNYYFPQVAVLHEHGQTINQHINHRKSTILKFKSESYYYHKYRGTSMLSIYFAGLFFNLFLYLKSKTK